MKLEINIPDDALLGVVNDLVERAFKVPGYSTDKGGAGFELVRAEVGKQVASVDVEAVVRDQVRRVATVSAAREAETLIQAMTRKVVRDMRAKGELFAEGKEQ